MSLLSRAPPPKSLPRPRDELWDLDMSLLWFSRGDPWSIRDACEGVQVFGGIGSGKTSGSGAAIAKSFLRAGFGGLVLCSKPEERALWERYCRETGRSSQLIIFRPGDHQWKFNFIDDQLQRATMLGGGLTENLVELLTTVTTLVEGVSGMDTGDKFWGRAMKTMLRCAIDILTLANDTLTLVDLHRFISEAPQSVAQVADESWQQSSFMARCISKAQAKPKTAQQEHDFDVSVRYWLQSFAGMADRTKSSIVATFESVGDLLLHGVAHELLCTETTWLPELCFDGAITILDLPLQRYFEVGRIIQGIIKYAWQRAVLSRDITQKPRPVFLWIDEAQGHISPFDYEYQSTARSARACTVYLTQSITNIYARLGDGGRSQADALLGLFQTTIFHANADAVTNEWAAERIGRRWLTTYSFHSNRSDQGGSRGSGGSESVQYKVLPSEFTTLRKGGPANNLQVDAVIFQGGRVWNASGDTYLRTIFTQG
ncbi:MAG: type IV secretory system conjugative DNA transfer family protein [Caldilineaceae bacterium]